ncbi:MAG: hypothetical protein EBS07_09880, partial [Sphingobacteriia bacterium]|nr:hypothetical protein [Sphingobacteriia bacterium]
MENFYKISFLLFSLVQCCNRYLGLRINKFSSIWGLAFLGIAIHAYGQTQTFNYTGSAQTFVVPTGVTSLTVEAWGAKGGNSGYTGANGGYTRGTITVTPGQTINVYVGGQGALPAGGWNGGGNGGSTSTVGAGGGGASDIRIGGSALADRVMVAAGGGGSGGSTIYNATGGAGGSGTFCASPYGNGGQGGGGCAIGGNGGCAGGVANNYGTGGAGGGLTSGGATSGSGTGVFGTAGTLGIGGVGGNFAGRNGGGGGGGGYYGGAGGMSGNGGCNGGGGGGSSYVDNSIFSSITLTGGNNAGDGRVTFTWTVPNCSGTPNGGTATANGVSPLSLCSNASISLSSTGITTGSGITYQWQSAPSSTGPWTNISGGTTVPYSLTPVFNTWYQVLVNCSVSGSQSVSTPVQVTGGAPTGGTALANGVNPLNICTGPSYTLTSTGITTGTGVTYQWQSAPSSTGPWTNVSGGTTMPFNTSALVNTWYQAQVTCPISGSQTISSPVQVNIAPIASPSALNTTITCGSSATLVATGSTSSYQWYDAPIGGNLLSSSATLVTPALGVSTTYYVQATSGTITGNHVFGFTGSVQTWTVPSGVTSITIDAIGASGGNITNYGNAGRGGRLQTTLAVTPGQTLNIYVGGTTTTITGGYNGGGNASNSTWARGGGGATDIRIGGTTLADRVVVAAGGGGSGYNCSTNNHGGNGGGLIGADGWQCNSQTSYVGLGGTQTAGGAFGNNLGQGCGTAGTLGIGGTGACTYGGGGGGGYYGGGGGGFGGGGGGSSWVTPTGSSGTTNTAAFNTGNGQITISYSQTLCASARVPVVVTVPPTQSNPTALGTTINCGTSATLTATGSTGNYVWYSAPNGGTVLATTSSFTTPTLTATNTYYVQATTSSPGGTASFSFTGSPQTWTVPSGVTSVTVDARGASGGNITNQGNPGLGGRVQGTISVTPGQVLNIYVGGTTTTTTGGYNGGGNSGSTSFTRGGGGATDIRIGGTALTNRVLVAAGGGGSGYNCSNNNHGGNGGGTTGADGWQCGSQTTYVGIGGNQTNGGAFGNNLGQGCGTAGTLGIGGNGACTYGGGGGGGYYGGGGGGYGGGGGGSSWVTPTGSSGITHTPANNTGNGQISLTWTGQSCGSQLVPVVVTVNPVTVPTTSNVSMCSPGSTTLTCSGSTGTYAWYSVPTGGTPISTTSSYTTPSLLTSTTYYVEAMSSSISCTQNSLANILTNLNTNQGAIISTIPSPYNFAMDGPGGVNSTYISDGGNDMYDGGNYLNTNYLTNFTYSNNTILSSGAFGTGSQYFTLKTTSGLWVLAADMNNVTWFELTGNNGADGFGNVDATSFNVTVGCQTYNVFLKRVYNAGDPSINQMIIIPQNGGASQTWSTNTDNTQHRVTGINTNTRLYYLLYAGTSGLFINNTQAQTIATTFLTQVSAAATPPPLCVSARVPVAVNIGANLVPTASIVASPNSAICQGTNVSFSASVTNSGLTPTYQWLLNGSPIFGQTNLNFASTTLNNNDQVSFVLNAPGACITPNIVNSNTITMQVNPVPATPSPVNNGPLCAGSTVNLSVAPVSFASYAWAGPNSFVSTSLINFIPGSTVAMSGVYSSWISVAGCTSLPGLTTLTVTAPVGAQVIGSAQTICSGNSPSTLTGAAPTGGNGVYAYQWQSSLNGITFAPITGSVNQTLNSVPLTVTTYFRRVATSGACAPQTSSQIQVWVDSLIGSNVIQSNQTLCAGNTAQALTGTIPTGGNGNYSYNWESSLNQTTWNSTGINTQGISPGSLLVSTYYRRVIGAGVCNPSTSTQVDIVVDPIVSANTISGAQTICIGTTHQALTGSTPSGGNGAYSFDWESSSDDINWISTGVTTQGYAGTVLNASTYFRRSVVSGPCGNISSSLFIKVDSLIGNNSIQANQTICFGTAPQLISGSLPSGGNGNYVYGWESSLNQIGWANANTTVQNYTSGNLNATTYFRRSVSAGVCPGTTSQTLEVKVDSLIGNNTITGSATLCALQTGPVLTGSTPSGG